MKYLTELLCLTFVLIQMGCKSEADYDLEWVKHMEVLRRASSERLSLNQLYPALLERENAHKITVRLHKSPPSRLSYRDLKEIYNLLSRIPGLIEYKVEMIKESTMFPGCVDVYVNHKKIILKNENIWKVYMVKGVYANSPENMNDPNDSEMIKLWKLRSVELLPLNNEYPVLLPPEKARNMKCLVSKPPTGLTKEDLSEIFKLVGRIPGLWDSTVRLVTYSSNEDGIVELFVGDCVIVEMKKQDVWRVYKVSLVSP